MFIRNGNRHGAPLRGTVRGARSFLRGAGRCTIRLRCYKSQGDCTGASVSTAFVRLGRSTVGGKRIGPTCGMRCNISTKFIA